MLELRAIDEDRRRRLSDRVDRLFNTRGVDAVVTSGLATVEAIEEEQAIVWSLHAGSCGALFLDVHE